MPFSSNYYAPGLTLDDQRNDFAQRLASLNASTNLPVEPGTKDFLDGFRQHSLTAWRATKVAIPRPAGVSEVTDTYPVHDHSEIPRRAEQLPVLIVPGLLGDIVRPWVTPFMVRYKQCVLPGHDIQLATINGRRGCDANALQLRPQVLALAEKRGRPVHLVGYSKGCTDAIHMLVNYPETHDAVASLTSYAGVVGGTALAGQAPTWVRRILAHMPLPSIDRGDGRALRDLTITYRLDWMQRHQLPESVRYFSIVAVPTPARVSRLLTFSWRQLATVTPHNDSQVDAAGSILPNSQLLAVLNADHWAAALPIEQRLGDWTRIFLDANRYPRSLVLKTLIDHLAQADFATA